MSLLVESPVSVVEIEILLKIIYLVSSIEILILWFFFGGFKNYFVTIFLAPYGTTMSRMPTNMGRQQQGFMMDPHAGKLKVCTT